MPEESPKLTTIYLVRHGQSASNAAHATGVKVIAEASWGTDLTDEGISQAKQVAKRFKDVTFDAVFSSDLLRAKHTAEIIALERELAVITNETIRESNANSFHHFDPEKQAEMKELLNKMTQEEKVRFRGNEKMESYEDAATRLITFLREISIAYEGGTVLVVAHGTLIRAFLIKLGFATYDELPSGSLENTGYAVLTSDGIDFFIQETCGVHRTEVT